MSIISNFPVGGGGSLPSGPPNFTYTGAYTLLDDGNKNWRLKLLTSGTLRFSKVEPYCQVFMVGGGAGGTFYITFGNIRYGGGGGYTLTASLIIQPDIDYPVVIGAGGTGGQSTSNNGAGTSGGSTSAFGSTVQGGQRGKGTAELPDGGSGGGCDRGNGGSDGSDGTGSNKGIGQHTTTREFGEPDGTLYAAGGGGFSTDPSSTTTGKAGDDSGGNGGVRTVHHDGYNAPANRGGGGGAGVSASTGANAGKGGDGGSGIVVIRNHREAAV